MPQILAPLFSLFASLQLGRQEGGSFSPGWYLLLIPAAALTGGILMAFRAVPGAATLEADYTHGWLYYLAMTWTVALLMATGAWFTANAAFPKADSMRGCRSVFFWEASHFVR